MLKKDIQYSTSNGLHTATYLHHRVAIESTDKHISKATKDYLKECLEEVVGIRETMGKRY